MVAGLLSAREALMRPREVTGDERTDDRELTRERKRCAHFCKRVRAARTAQPQDIETRALCRKRGATADSADHQVRDGNRRIQTAIACHLEPRDAHGGLRDACNVLPTCEVHGRETVRVVPLAAEGSHG